MKKALVIRYGAFGDAIMVSSILPFLKRDGYHINMNCTDRVRQVLINNPYIDEWMIYKDDSVPNDKLDEHWAEVSRGFDKVINLTGSIEDSLLIPEFKPDKFWADKDEVHGKCNVNYYDRTMELAGYPVKGMKGELYFSRYERMCANQLRKKFKNKFLILWSLSGSAFHKVYPFTEEVACRFLDAHPDAYMITVGDVFCRILEFPHPQIRHRSDGWCIRRSMAVTQVADLVVGTETGIINAAGCFNTPKIVLLSHSSKENLTKYFDNCISLYAKDCECYPCHRLIYSRHVCMTDPVYGATECMAKISPEMVLDSMETFYERWKEKKRWDTS